jgi:hypothetical protein
VAVVLRFVEGTAIWSKAIIALEKTAMPFTPSHVEVRMPDGALLGARFNGGVQKRPMGYDNGHFSSEFFLSLATSEEQATAFHAFLESHIGEPYDWPAIMGFLIPAHLHDTNHTICSALVARGLRTCEWFSTPLATPEHLISPRDLLVMLSARMYVPMTKRGDTWV